MKSLSALLLLVIGHSTVVSPFGHSFRLGDDSNRVGRGLDGANALVGMAVRPRRSSPSPYSSTRTTTTTTTTTTKRKLAASSDDRRSPPSDEGVAAGPLLPRRTAAAVERRPFLRDVAALSLLLPTSSVALAAEATASIGGVVVDQLPPKVTHKVRMDVRISRADGSFYVRDAPPPAASASSSSSSSVVNDDDDPFYGTLVLGLFGDVAPVHVGRFLGYVDVPYDVDSPLPSYSRSKFDTLDASTGLLIGGTIPGLAATTLAGGTVLEYSGRVFPARLWLEDHDNDRSASTRLSHGVRGLLTHRDLDLTPSFGITTRNGGSASLDGTHTVFGCVLEDEGGFLGRVVDVPSLTDAGMVTRTSTENERPRLGGGGSGGALAVGGPEFESLASGVFAAQRRVFRDAARTLGDSRLDKVYDGKLLRRIEVTKVGTL